MSGTDVYSFICLYYTLLFCWTKIVQCQQFFCIDLPTNPQKMTTKSNESLKKKLCLRKSIVPMFNVDDTVHLNTYLTLNSYATRLS